MSNGVIGAALVTGNSSGFGLGLTRVLQGQGARVYGMSRRGCPEPGVAGDERVDLADFEATGTAMERLLDGVDALDLVILNAGLLGHMQRMQDASMDELRLLMDVNTFANKVILDALLRRHIRVGQVVAISSGASVSGHAGWSGYSLSKAALNMMMQLYAHEFPEDTAINALAPGLIDTSMQDYLCEEADREAFPVLQRLKAARGTETMPTPEKAAEAVLAVLPRLRQTTRGSFVDIRQLD
ncbi:short-chain dehydrogenase/reductase SDR [Thioalkalivibrio sp. K90mix]|uniref:SDR family NAD(P)-dependent oxidoreductase n=1 Tax=unclassified Thioalkalivibrio TaxID=2621013 RepID=UPI000195AAFF|nr:MULTISPECIES: SDR family NAD(P)-dependent oxidoreductase [unclassified Thioalkalivibrio]ADC73049.1 short-chain dehydrogenase/reductase SDR [Thioalkalivibrio sp. K90mix]